MAAENDGTTEALVEAVVTRVMEKIDERLSRRQESTRSDAGLSLEDSGGTTRDPPARSGNQYLPLHTRVKPGQPWCCPICATEAGIPAKPWLVGRGPTIASADSWVSRVYQYLFHCAARFLQYLIDQSDCCVQAEGRSYLVRLEPD